jgi:hypothetical protein
MPATALLAALAICLAAPSQAQDELFVEGFEGAKFCMWSSSTSGETDCVSCAGKPDGTPCADPLITSCGGCFYDGPCDEFAERNCPCFTYSCSAGACVATSGSCPQPCVRNTDGNSCGAVGCGPGLFIDRCCEAGACVNCSPCQGSGLELGSDLAKLQPGGFSCAAPAARIDSAFAAFLASRDRDPGAR